MIDADIAEGNVRILLTKVDPNKETPSILNILPYEEGENPNLGHVISAVRLPGIRSRNKKFWDPQAEEAYKDVYGGNVVLLTRTNCSEDETSPTKFEFGAFLDFFTRK